MTEAPEVDSLTLNFGYGITPAVQAAVVSDIRKAFAERTLLNAIVEYELAHDEYYRKRAVAAEFPSDYRLVLAKQTKLMATNMLMEFYREGKDG